MKKKRKTTKRTTRKSTKKTQKKSYLPIILLLVLIIGGGYFVMNYFKPIATSPIQEKTTQPIKVPQQAQIKDACKDLKIIQEKIQLLAKEITNAETELEGLEIDLAFAKEDNTNVVETQKLITNQKNYLQEINSELKELQDLITDC